MRDGLPTAFAFRLPRWLRTELAGLADTCHTSEAARMRLAIGLAEANVRRGTGGPFGAAVFEQRTGRLVAAGVNLVVHTRCTCLHAEVVALILAQRRLRTYDLAAAGAYELHTSVAPCAMCLGAAVWSGVRRVACGARGSDAEALGFDEGPKPADWADALRARGIAVRQDLLRREATAILRLYGAQGGPIYNPARHLWPVNRKGSEVVRNSRHGVALPQI